MFTGKKWRNECKLNILKWIGFTKIIIKVSRYRHYGVYLTGEKESSGGLEEILENPVYALDR